MIDRAGYYFRCKHTNPVYQLHAIAVRSEMNRTAISFYSNQSRKVVYATGSRREFQGTVMVCSNGLLGHGSDRGIQDSKTLLLLTLCGIAEKPMILGKARLLPGLFII